MRRQWTEEDVETLKLFYPNHTAQFVADMLGRNLSSVQNKSNALGLSKSKDFWKSVTKPPSRTQFKKGNIPWNAGIKGSTGLHPNTRATQFKKGEVPKNTLPDGSVRLTKDGYLERKNNGSWVALHRLVWEEVNGAIPAGYIVVFKPGLKTSVEDLVTIDRLECITRAENAKRNSLHRFGPEMAKLYQLKGAIARQVNRISRNDMGKT